VQSPQLTVTWRASNFTIDGRRTWVFNEHWNQIASSMANLEQELLRETKKTGAMAAELAGGRSGKEAGAVLLDFVREEMMSVDTWLYYEDDEPPHVDKVLEARSGSIYEKAYLLLAMLRSLGMEAELIWAHDPAEGGYFDDYPSWGQMLEPLIRTVADGNEVWLDLQCGTCPPGDIRGRLRDVPAISYLRDAHDRDEKLWDFVVQDAYGRRIGVYQHYMANLKKKTWHRMIRTPGRNRRFDGWCSETLVWRPDGTADLQVLSLGRTSLAARIENEGDAAEGGRRWARARFTEMAEVTTRGTSPEDADTLKVDFGLEGDPPAPPMGDTWILPPQAVFGEPCMEAWPAERITDFHVPLTTLRQWEFRAPLPAGWEEVDLPRDRIVQAGPLSYRIQYAAREGEIVVSRILAEKAGTIHDRARIATIGEQSAAIVEVETSPVIVRRRKAGS